MAQAAIASTYNSDAPSSYPQNTPSFVEDIQPVANISSQVAAILPPSIPFNLGTGGSDTESDPSTSVSPISVPHYTWNATIHGRDEFPTPITCLLDNGAHLVLIRPETVADLGLNIRKLHTPQSVTVAINSERQTFQLFDYVVALYHR